MAKFPRNHSVGLSKVANIDNTIGKSDFADLILRVNDLHAGDLIETDIHADYVVDMSVYRTFKITLFANATITITGLEAYKEGYLIVDPQEYLCLINRVRKEDNETTLPQNLTLYRFYGLRPGIIELKQICRNMYGSTEGEFNNDEFLGDFSV